MKQSYLFFPCLFVGQKQKFHISVRTPENYPVDVYMLMDMSFSMKDNLKSVETLGLDLGVFAVYVLF